MVDDLRSLPASHRLHQAGNPRAGIRLAEGNATAIEQVEHELKVLQFLDSNGVEFCHAWIEITVFLQVERRGGRFAFQVRVVDEHGREVGQDLRQPIRRDLFAEQQHASVVFWAASARQAAKLGLRLLLVRPSRPICCGSITQPGPEWPRPHQVLSWFTAVVAKIRSH